MGFSQPFFLSFLCLLSSPFLLFTTAAVAMRTVRTGSVLCLVNDTAAGGHDFLLRDRVLSSLPQGEPWAWLGVVGQVSLVGREASRLFAFACCVCVSLSLSSLSLDSSFRALLLVLL